VPVRLVFAGTPETALPALRRLIDSPRHDVVAVLTRPDAASGRRGRPEPSAVAREALDRGIPLLRPSRPNSPEFVGELSELAPECCAVVAYGALLRDELLAVPPRGWINLHFSLLPAWRGAAPVQAAIAAGDTITGATTFQIERAMDSGPVYGVVTETIQPTDTAGDLFERLAISGAALLSTTLDGIADATLTPRPQPTDGVSMAPKITVEQARVRWDLPAPVVERRIRAVTPNPGAWTLIGDLRIKLGPVHLDSGPEAPIALPPGGIHVARKGVWIGTGSDPVRLDQIQPPGKKVMNAVDWARGARLDPAARAS
jgi:methionyl-tRNA formyltransferase